MSNAGRSGALVLGLCILHSICLMSAPVASAHSKVAARTVAGYLMVIPVGINGQGPFDFVVDTGTNRTLIDTDLAEQLGLKALDQVSVANLTGTEAASRYFLDSVTVGSESAANLEVLSLAMQPLHAVDKRVRGVLALNFLARFSFLLDFKHRYIELYQAAESPNLAGGTRVRAEIAEGRILIPAESEASTGGWRLALDSGISRMLVFESRIAAIQVANRSSRSTTTTMRNVVIANRHFRNISVVVLQDAPPTLSKFEDGLLPASLFQSVFVNAKEGFVVFSFD